MEEGGKHADDRLCGKRTKERAQVSFPSGMTGGNKANRTYRDDGVQDGGDAAEDGHDAAADGRDHVGELSRGGKESFKSRGGSQPSRVALWLLPPKSSSR